MGEDVDGRKRTGSDRKAVRSGFSRVARLDVFALAAALWFLGKLVRYAFPPLFEPLQASYGVSNAAVGAAFTGFMLVYAAMQFPSGLLADRFGSVRVIVSGAVLATVGAFVVAASALSPALAGSFLLLVVAMAILGGGTGAHKTVAVRLLSRVYPARTGRVLGAFDTFGTFGGVVAPIAVVVFVVDPGWRALFFLFGIAGLVLAGMFSLRIPRRYPEETRPVAMNRSGGEAAETVGLADYAGLFRDRRFAAFVGVTLLFSFAYNGTVAFLPLYLVREAGLEPAIAGVIYSALFLASLSQLVSGDASDRVGQLPVITAALGLAAIALSSLLFLSGSLALGVAVIALGIGAHGFRPVRGAYLMRTLPESVAGGGFGVVRTMLMGAGAIAPAIVGVLSDVSGFRVAFGLLAVALMGAVAIAGALLVSAGGSN